MSRWLRWVIRIGVGILAVSGAITATLFFLDPGGTIIVLALLVQPLVSNTHPPPIAEDQLVVANRGKDEASHNLSSMLQRRFPAGSSENVLISTLSTQGFKPYLLAPNQGRCLPVYEPRVDPDNHIMRMRCDAYDPGRTYKYSWGGGICDSSIIVWWTADERGNILKAAGAYDSVCL